MGPSINYGCLKRVEDYAYTRVMDLVSPAYAGYAKVSDLRCLQTNIMRCREKISVLNEVRLLQQQWEGVGGEVLSGENCVYNVLIAP